MDRRGEAVELLTSKRTSEALSNCDLLNSFWLSQLELFRYHSKNEIGMYLPPLQGHILWRYYQANQESEKVIDYIKTLYPIIISNIENLYISRNPFANGLITSSQIGASGKLNLFNNANQPKKNLPLYIDPLFNSVLVYSVEGLTSIARELELEVRDLFIYNEQTTYAINEMLWIDDQSIYGCYDLEMQKFDHKAHITGFGPMTAGIPDIDQLLGMVKKMFGDSYRIEGLRSIPSLNPEETTFDFTSFGQGSISAELNWFLLFGLQRYGFDELMQLIINDTQALIEVQGFRSSLDPRISRQFENLDTQNSVAVAAIYIDLLELII